MTSIDAAVSAVCDRISKPLARTRRLRGYREGHAGSMAGRRKRRSAAQNLRNFSDMPEQTTLKRARAAKRAGRAPSTQAGEFVREEMDHIREGKHGARSTKQAIAIGLSKARKAGVDLPAPEKGTTSERTRRAAKRALRQGRRGHKTISSSRSRATRDALKREGHAAASKKALARQARSSARKRSASSRRASARQAARTKGPALRRSAARRAAATRRRRSEA